MIYCMFPRRRRIALHGRSRTSAGAVPPWVTLTALSVISIVTFFVLSTGHGVALSQEKTLAVLQVEVVEKQAEERLLLRYETEVMGCESKETKNSERKGWLTRRTPKK